MAEQAGTELAVGGEPHAVAALAVVVAHRRDHAHRSPGVRKAVVRRGTVSRRARNRLELRDALQPFERFGARDERVRRQREVGARGHQLDEAHVPGPLAREGGEIRYLVVVGAPHQDDVQLDRLEPGVLCSREAGHHACGGPRPPGERVDAFRTQRVQGHVQAANARGLERAGVLVQEDGVSGEREVVDARDARDHAREGGHVAAHERLAARDAHAAQAERRHGADDARDLFVREQLVPAQPRQALLGHAVDTAEVALVRHRDAQVLDAAAEPVDHRSPARPGALSASDPLRGSSGRPSTHCAPPPTKCSCFQIGSRRLISSMTWREAA